MNSKKHIVRIRGIKMENNILFDNKIKIDFNNSYLINYYINNQNDNDNKLIAFRILLKNSLNKFLNIDDDNYSYIDINSDKFEMYYIELENLNSSFLAEIVSFEKEKDKYKITFKKNNSFSTIAFNTNDLKITLGKLVKKENLKSKKKYTDLLMLMNE